MERTFSKGFPMTAPQMEAVTGMTLQQRRLLVLIQEGSDRRSSVQWYGEPGAFVCVVCGEQSLSLRAFGHDATRCDREVRQILLFGAYLLARGIHPFKKKTGGA